MSSVIESMTGPVDLGEPVGRGAVVPSASSEVAVQDCELPAEYARAAIANGSSGVCRVEVEDDPPPAPGLVDVVAGRGHLGVERVGENHRRDVAEAGEDLERRGQVLVAVLGRAGQEVEEPATGQGQRAGALVRLARAGEGVVEPALALHRRPASQWGQLVPPAIVSAVSGVVVGDRPLERSPEVVVFPVDRRSATPAGRSPEYAAALCAHSAA